MKKHSQAAQKIYCKGGRMLSDIVYNHCVNSGPYVKLINSYKLYARRYGARKARTLFAGIKDADDYYIELMLDYYASQGV